MRSSISPPSRSTKSPNDLIQHHNEMSKKVKRERDEEQQNSKDRDDDGDKSDSELVVDDIGHNEGSGTNGSSSNGVPSGSDRHNGLNSRSPHENGNGNGNGDLIQGQSAKQVKKEENSRSPHSDNSSRSTPSIKVIKL